MLATHYRPTSFYDNNNLKKLRSRYNYLSPCKESNLTDSTSMGDKSKKNDSSHYPQTSSSATTSAFNRLRYNLSPVSSYYKPFIKTFSKRDDSPKVCIFVVANFFFYF